MEVHGLKTYGINKDNDIWNNNSQFCVTVEDRQNRRERWQDTKENQDQRPSSALLQERRGSVHVPNTVATPGAEWWDPPLSLTLWCHEQKCNLFLCL